MLASSRNGALLNFSTATNRTDRCNESRKELSSQLPGQVTEGGGVGKDRGKSSSSQV